MEVIDLLVGGGALLATLAVGTVAHEFSHAAVLRALGVPYDIDWHPGSATGPFGVGVYRAWATVTPRSIPTDVPTAGLRIAAIAPLALATPFVLILVGVVPDPVEIGNVVLTAATVAWFACALPSPQDFSLFWHVEQVYDECTAPPSEH